MRLGKKKMLLKTTIIRSHEKARGINALSLRSALFTFINDALRDILAISGENGTVFHGSEH